MRLVTGMMIVALAFAAPLAAQDAKDKKVDQAALLAAVRPATVIVQFHLRYDKGEPPRGGLTEGLTAVGGRWFGGQDAEQSIRDEVPLTTGGWLIGDTTVVAADLNIADRFIEKITVRKGDAVVDAKRVGVGVDRSAAFYELAGKLDGAAPLAFDPAAEGPYRAVVWHDDDGEWEMGSTAMGDDAMQTVNGRNYITPPGNVLVTTGAGKPVGMSYLSALPADGSWKGAPDTWKQLSEADFTARRDATVELADNALLRVTLNFRSPRKDESGAGRFQFGDDGEEAATELHAVGVVLGADRVLVLADLKPKVTARLERVRVFDASGQATAAKFIGSLTDYGALVVEPEKPVGKPAAIGDGGVLDLRGDLLIEALVRVQGEQRTAYISHDRVSSFSRGWRGHVYPQPGKADSESFLFDLDGKLVVLPVTRREKVAVERRWNSDSPTPTAAGYLAEALKDLPANTDSHNVPLSEEEANRVAWLGVVLQPLDRDLARLNNVADVSQDGQIGGLVTFVYPGSPAAEAGIEPGAIFLRIHPAAHPQPIDVQVDEDPWSGRPFPWDRLDELPEQLFDRIPTPWPTVETTLARTLTELGWDTEYAADFYVDGKPVKKQFKVVAGPRHYESAPKQESEALGLTVRDLTYEVRRYLQVADDAPGVVISKIEPGSKASVAGVKPYEQITAVNDTAVSSADEFAKAIESASGEVRLSIKRMTRSRQVAIKIDAKPKPEGEAAPAEPAAEPAAEGAAEEAAK